MEIRCYIVLISMYIKFEIKINTSMNILNKQAV